MSKYKNLEKNSGICKKCGHLMVTREHSKISEKILRQPYYFSRWDVCPRYNGGCGMVQHYEENKIWNKNSKAEIVKLYEEKSEQESLFNYAVNGKN